MQAIFPDFSTSHGDALRDIHERHGVSYNDLAKWGGVSYATVNGWSNDHNGGPGWNVLGLWMRRDELPTAAKIRLLRGILAGTSLRVVDADTPTLAQMDADGDGDVDHRDLLIKKSKTASRTTATVTELAESQRQRRLSAEQIAVLREREHQTIDEANERLAMLDRIESERIAVRLNGVHGAC